MMTPKFNHLTAILDRSVHGHILTGIVGNMDDAGGEETDILPNPIAVVRLNGGADFKPEKCLAVKKRGKVVDCNSSENPCGKRNKCPIYQRVLEYAASEAIISATVLGKKKRYPD